MTGWDGVSPFFENDPTEEEIQALTDAYDRGELRPPLTYWLKPKNWRNETVYWLHDRGWRKYCHVHDRIHWAWTHRHCCANQRAYALRALRKGGFLR